MNTNHDSDKFWTDFFPECGLCLDFGHTNDAPCPWCKPDPYEEFVIARAEAQWAAQRAEYGEVA